MPNLKDMSAHGDNASISSMTEHYVAPMDLHDFVSDFEQEKKHMEHYRGTAEMDTYLEEMNQFSRGWQSYDDTLDSKPEE